MRPAVNSMQTSYMGLGGALWGGLGWAGLGRGEAGPGRAGPGRAGPVGATGTGGMAGSFSRTPHAPLPPQHASLSLSGSGPRLRLFGQPVQQPGSRPPCVSSVFYRARRSGD